MLFRSRPVAAAAKEKPVTVLEKSVAVEAAPLLSTAQSAAQDSVVIGSGLRLPPRKFKCTPARRVGML